MRQIENRRTMSKTSTLIRSVAAWITIGTHSVPVSRYIQPNTPPAISHAATCGTLTGLVRRCTEAKRTAVTATIVTGPAPAPPRLAVT
jgi:hypothetical protein